MVGSDYTYCPMCGCEDGQGCSKDCPSEVIPRLLAENAKLLGELSLMRIMLKRIWDCNPTSVCNPYDMIHEMRVFARSALGGEG